MSLRFEINHALTNLTLGGVVLNRVDSVFQIGF